MYELGVRAANHKFIATAENILGRSLRLICSNRITLAWLEMWKHFFSGRS